MSYGILDVLSQMASEIDERFNKFEDRLVALEGESTATAKSIDRLSDNIEEIGKLLVNMCSDPKAILKQIPPRTALKPKEVERQLTKAGYNPRSALKEAKRAGIVVPDYRGNSTRVIRIDELVVRGVVIEGGAND